MVKGRPVSGSYLIIPEKFCNLDGNHLFLYDSEQNSSEHVRLLGTAAGVG